MPIDLFEHFNIKPTAQATTPQDNTVDLLALRGIKPGQAQTTDTSLIDRGIDAAKSFVGGAAKPVWNAYLGAWQMGGDAAEKVGAISPETNANLQSTLGQMHGNIEQKLPTGGLADLAGQAVGYGVTGGPLTGQLSKFLPETSGALQGALKSVAANAASGAVTGGAGYVEPGSEIDHGTNAALGALGGGAFAAGASALGAAKNGILGAINRTPLEREAIKLGANTDKLVQTKDKLLNSISQVQSDVAAGDLTHTAVNQFSDKLKNIYSGLYDEASKAAGLDAKIASPELAKHILEVQSSLGDKIPAPILNKLNQYKIFSPGGSEDLTVDEANKLTKLINSRWGASADPAERLALRQINQGIYNAMDKVGGDSPAVATLSQARQARQAYDQVFNRDNILSDIVSKKSASEFLLQPEQLVDKITSGVKPVHNIELIKDVLLNQDKSPEALTAWSALQRTGLQNQLLDKATKVDGSWDSKAFLKHYDRLGPEFIGALTNGDERLLGRLALLKAASKEDLDSAGSISKQVLGILKNHIGSAIAGAVGVGAVAGLAGLGNKSQPSQSSGIVEQD
jgi:hypothetical protein